MTDEQRVLAGFAPAIARLDGDIELLRAMAAIACEDLPAIHADIEEAIDEGNCAEAEMSLHRIKGMLSTFQSDGVTLEIQDLLDLARKEQEDEVRALYRRRKPAIDALIERISEIAREGG